MDKSCGECKYLDKCYPLATGSDPWPSSVVRYFNAISARDLCVNNGKDKYESIKT